LLSLLHLSKEGLGVVFVALPEFLSADNTPGIAVAVIVYVINHPADLLVLPFIRDPLNPLESREILIVDCIPSLASGEVSRMDQKLFEAMGDCDVGYVCGGKLYSDITDAVRKIPQKAWGSYFGTEEIEDNQLLLSFARPCAVIYTNLGMGYGVDEQLRQSGFESMLTPEGIIACYHHRGRSELAFRLFKEFADQRLPFERFRPNAAFYYLMCIAFFLYAAFKEDVCGDIVPITSYPISSNFSC
jgi:hypothetical protein